MRFEKCAECAKKHVRAAYAYAVEEILSGRPSEIPISTDGTMQCMVSRAAVLASEAKAYPRHMDYAVGLFVMAEDLYPQVEAIRLARLAMESCGSYAIKDFIPCVSMMLGHLLEARREGWIELPETVTPGWVVKNFDGLIKAAEMPAPEERKEGEEAMACAKKAACKGGKCAKAACKGGKAKKAACKGGKSCK